MTNISGEDRSNYQGVAGWGGDYFGFAKATEGPDWTDPTFKHNWANLRAEGKPRGAYHFFHPADDPVEQARYCYSAVAAQGIIAGDMFLADMEILVGADGLEDYGTALAPHRAHTGLRATSPAGFTPESLAPAALQFLNELKTLAGPAHRVLLYTDQFMASSLLGNCSAYPLFIAYYSAAVIVPAPWKTWTFWQSRSGGGPGGGDLDYFNGDLAALDTWTKPAPAPVPHPKPLPADWTYPPVAKLTGKGGDTTVALEWNAPAQPAGEAPLPAIAEYEVAATLGPKLEGPDMKTYPRFTPKGKNPEEWQGGSFPRKMQVTLGSRACYTNGTHAGEWATVTVSTT
jgi:hypothetical protein